MYFSLTYADMNVKNRLPRGVMTPSDTFDAAMKRKSKFKMHSCTVFGSGFEFLGVRKQDVERCELYTHSDYVIQLTSENLFTESQRNIDCKYIFNIKSVICDYN